MSDNLPNITIPANDWIDLYSIAGIDVGTAISVENIGICDVYLAVQETEPDQDHDSYNIVQRGNGIRLQNNDGDSGAWAFCQSVGGKITVHPVSSTGFYPHSTTALKSDSGKVIDENNPLPVSDIDNAHRISLNSIFGDKIVGIRKPSISGQFQYGLRSDDAVVDSVGSGTTSFGNAMLILNTGTDVDGHIGIQGADYLRYLPGHEAYAFFTCVFAPPVANSIQRIGIFDYDGGNGNGFFVGYNGTQFGLTRRRAGVDTFHAVDTSGVYPKEFNEFDPTKGNVYKISYGYLGFATIHVDVLLPHGGFAELASIDYPNTSTETHIANTNIPLRAEMTNTGNNTDLGMKIGSVSAGIVNGGGVDPIARQFSFEGGITASGTVQLFTFRNKGTFFGLTNKITSQLSLISASTEGIKPVAWKIIKNPTITTPGTWTDINTTDSVMEYSNDQVNDVNTGTLMIAWKMSKAGSFFQEVSSLLLSLRPNEYAVIVAVTTASNEMDLSFRWEELF